MNILYIFGNGLDKAQGMATGYPEFYEYLRDHVTSGSDLLNRMKTEITEKQKLWSDMEERLGAFTDVSNNADEFYNFYFELNEHLQSYLTKENEKFLPTDKLKTKFQDDFIKISKYLAVSDKDHFNTFIKKHNSLTKDISVITLNYTNTLEKILNLSGGATTKGFGGGNMLRNLIHVHGLLGQSIIIGVDNETQIKNEEFKKNDDIKDLMIKEQSNLVMKETRHIQCENLINKANVIILFGVSLGDTDARWWKIIGNNLVSRTNIAIIHHLYEPDAISRTQLQKRGRLEREQQKSFMQKMRIEEKNWNTDLTSRLFFTVNEPIFIDNSINPLSFFERSLIPLAEP